MKKILVVTAESLKFCLDMAIVADVCTDPERIREVLLELESNHLTVDEVLNDASAFYLGEMISVKGQKKRNKPPLVVIADDSCRFGLFVDSVQIISDVAEEAFQAMPLAFPPFCRECFPQVVVLGGEAISVITPASIMKLAQHTFNEIDKG